MPSLWFGLCIAFAVSMKFAAIIIGTILGVSSCAGGTAEESAGLSTDANRGGKPLRIRVALFNIRELSTEILTDVDSRGVGRNPQILSAAAIVKRVNPDILIVNEIDHDYDSLESGNGSLDENARRFNHAYLNQGPDAIDYPYFFASPCNTGIFSGHDLNGDGKTSARGDRGTDAYGSDCFGYGRYPGQYSMAVLSRLPFGSAAARTFREFLWKDFPNNHMPPGFFSNEAVSVFRLSSKSHWDLPVVVDGRTLHLLLAHPTPTVFDGEEDRNGRRNFDENLFWIEYIDRGSALYDDNGVHGGLKEGASFLIAGDLNNFPEADPDYEGKPAVVHLLDHPAIRDSGPFITSAGGLQGRNPGAPGFPERSTTRFRDFGARIDYILPSADLKILNGAVFWPHPDADPAGYRLAEEASDHRLVWLDLEF